jgi:polysaccharide pyruvyl transferase WcaK-like protein
VLIHNLLPTVTLREETLVTLGENIFTDRSNMLNRNGNRPKIGLYGNFGGGNFGNESTLQAMLYHLRRLVTNAEITCICTFPEKVVADYNIAAVPISETIFKTWASRNIPTQLVRKLFIGIPSELYRWLQAARMLRDTDVLIVPGTGLLTDAYCLMGWGPYSIFKWSLAAKTVGCKVFFVSVGAGPLDSGLARWFIRSALSLADFRSYRDDETKEYLSSIGVSVANDKVYPDLAFSIAGEITPEDFTSKLRPVVGLGVMLYHSKLSSNKPGSSTYTEYLEQLAIFTKWLLARDYNVRLIVGELADRSVVAEFEALLKERLEVYDEERIISEQIVSFESLLAQLGETDAVVATRFHNVLWALALNKPVISISFHQKCTSLMQGMGLQDYCQNIHKLSAKKLIEQFCQLEKKSGTLKRMIRERVADRRTLLDEQYGLIFKDL